MRYVRLSDLALKEGLDALLCEDPLCCVIRDHSIEVIVTKRGEPVARLVSAAGSLPSAFGFMRGTVTGRGDIVSPDHEAWGGLG